MLLTLASYWPYHSRALWLGAHILWAPALGWQKLHSHVIFQASQERASSYAHTVISTVVGVIMDKVMLAGCPFAGRRSQVVLSAVAHHLALLACHQTPCATFKLDWSEILPLSPAHELLHWYGSPHWIALSTVTQIWVHHSDTILQPIFSGTDCSTFSHARRH